jgi:hypothetical protein
VYRNRKRLMRIRIQQKKKKNLNVDRLQRANRMRIPIQASLKQSFSDINYEYIDIFHLF